jgi:hypothetical protein
VHLLVYNLVLYLLVYNLVGNIDGIDKKERIKISLPALPLCLNPPTKAKAKPNLYVFRGPKTQSLAVERKAREKRREEKRREGQIESERKPKR